MVQLSKYLLAIVMILLTLTIVYADQTNNDGSGHCQCPLGATDCGYPSDFVGPHFHETQVRHLFCTGDRGGDVGVIIDMPAI